MFNVTSLIRKLAKSNYYQNLYALSKDIPSLRIFQNDRDFTQIQMLFLKYLNFYYNLNMDIALGEVTDVVLKDELYEDAYMMYKNKKDKTKEGTQNKKEDFVPSSRWLFKKPPK